MSKNNKKNKDNIVEFESAFYTMYIYVALVINVIVSFVKFSEKHNGISFKRINELSFDFNIVYIIFVSMVLVFGLYKFFKSTKKSIKELLLLILSGVVSFFVVPYLINNILMLLVILGVILFIYIYIVPHEISNVESKKETKVATTYGGYGEPTIKRFNKNTKVYRKGEYVYNSGIFGGEYKICRVDALESGLVRIYVGNKVITKKDL